MNPSQRTLRLVLTIIPITLVMAVLLISQQGVNSQQPIPLPESTAEIPVDTSPYKPSRYGIPDYIGGYKVLAVQTAENTGCFPEGRMIIDVQIAEPSVEAYLASAIGPNLQKVIDDMRISGYIVTLGISGPNATREDFARNNEQWNAGVRANSGECPTLGERQYGIAYETPITPGTSINQ